MDPITAIFNFLSTPVGQRLLSDLLAIDEALAGKIKDLFVHQVTATHAALPAAAEQKP